MTDMNLFLKTLPGEIFLKRLVKVKRDTIFLPQKNSYNLNIWIHHNLAYKFTASLNNILTGLKLAYKKLILNFINQKLVRVAKKHEKNPANVKKPCEDRDQDTS